MNIIIVGNGKLGSTIAEQLIRENHELTIVDTKSEVLESAVSSKDVRIVMLGSNYLMLDTQLLYSTENIYFTVNAFDWLVNSDNTVHITSKYVADSVLRVPDATTAWVLAAIVVVAIPLIVLVVGIVVWVKRRRL